MRDLVQFGGLSTLIVIVVTVLLIWMMVWVQREIRVWTAALATLNKELRDRASLVEQLGRLAGAVEGLLDRAEAQQARLDALEKRLEKLEGD